MATLSSQINEFYKGAEKHFGITRSDFLDDVALPEMITYNTSVLTEELEKKHGKIQDGESIATMVRRLYGEAALQWLLDPK